MRKSWGRWEGLTLQAPDTQSLVHLDAPSYSVIPTGCSVCWAPLSSLPEFSYLYSIQSWFTLDVAVELKYQEGKYVNRWLLVNGQVCPFPSFQQSMIRC